MLLNQLKYCDIFTQFLIILFLFSSKTQQPTKSSLQFSEDHSPPGHNTFFDIFLSFQYKDKDFENCSVLKNKKFLQKYSNFSLKRKRQFFYFVSRLKACTQLFQVFFGKITINSYGLFCRSKKELASCVTRVRILYLNFSCLKHWKTVLKQINKNSQKYQLIDLLYKSLFFKT